MKITAIKSFPVWAGGRNLFVLKIESDDGSYGYGEAGLSGRELAVRGAIDHFRRFLIGQDPRRIGALWQLVYRSQYFEGGRVLTAALSAIDIALHDLVARSLGVPVYQLLGGKQRERVPCFVTAATPPGPGIVEEVERLVAAGWPCIRTGIGYPKVEEPYEGDGRPDPVFEPRVSMAHTAEWIVKARAAVGRRAALGVDYHHRLSVGEAASFCQSMPVGTLDFLEGADPRRDAGGLRSAAAHDPGADGDRRGIRQQVAVPALPGTRHHRLRAARHLQRGRLHRGDEGGRLVRGALHRPDAAQPARPDQHGRQHPPGRGHAVVRLAGGAFAGGGIPLRSGPVPGAAGARRRDPPRARHARPRAWSSTRKRWR